MTAKELRAATLARKAEGKLTVYKRTPRAKSDGEPEVSPAAVAQSCANFGELTAETESCATCRGRTTLKVYECKAFGTCTVGKSVPGRGCCAAGCPSYAKKDS